MFRNKFIKAMLSLFILLGTIATAQGAKSVFIISSHGASEAQAFATQMQIFSTSDNQFDPGVDNQGWWSTTMSNYDENDNYSAGMDTQGNNPRNFFTFDLSALSLPVISATLELQRYEYWSTADSETYGLFDVSTDAVTLNNNVGTSTPIFEDLGTGTSYGEFEIFAEGLPEDILSFELNAAALADIDAAAGGWFSIGGVLLSPGSPVGDGTERLFGRSTGAGTQRLVVEVIPEPTTVVLLALGSLMLRKRK